MLGLALILGSLGVIVHDAATARAPAEIVVRETGRQSSEIGLLVQVEVVNRGDVSATAVEIEGQLKTTGQPEQTASVTLDHLPGGSRHTAALLFQSGDTGGALTVGAKGWATP